VKLGRGDDRRDSHADGIDDATAVENQMSRSRSLDEAPSRMPSDDNHSAFMGLHTRVGVVQEVLRSRLFLFVTLLTGLAYLFFFESIDVITAMPVMAEPSYFVLFYALIVVSSFLMGLNVYSLRSRLEKKVTRSSAAGGSSSVAASLFGSVISCSCHTSLLLPALTFVGASVTSGIGIISALVVYQVWILAVFILLNLYLAYRILGNIRPREG
jgi:hypothetical protein